MINHQYSEKDLVIAKLGTNPWWPGIIIKCSKTNKCYVEHENNRQVFVKFLEINTETWIEVGNVLNCTSKHDMEIYLSQLQINSPNSKYLNNVPRAMVDIYNKAWKLYDKMHKTSINHSEKSRDDDNMMVDKITTNDDGNGKINLQPCEICLNKMIEFESSQVNRDLLNMNADERKKYFSKIFIDSINDNDVKCGNFCIWKYHRSCAKDENDYICSCNKSVWMCNICDQPISVAQLFVCDNHQCMRPYHRSCLTSHFEMASDMKQCPLHHCINCSLDYIVAEGDTASVALVHCVKCKLAFHNDADCLPGAYMPITGSLIICLRHLVDVDALRWNEAGFCFACGDAMDGAGITCKYCYVTYHNRVPCKSASIELLDEHTFVCNNCRFPFARRGKYSMLTLPDQVKVPLSVNDWRFGYAVMETTDRHLLTIRGEDGNVAITDFSRTISINLQSLGHLACFGLLRFDDMQRAIQYLSSTVSEIRDRLGMRQTFHHNAFVLHYAGLFPLVDNLDLGRPPHGDDATSTDKCACKDCCTTAKCPNVASNIECTSANCSDVSRCRNRRLQKRHYPRCQMIIHPDNGTNVVLEEPIVKDILVMEIVGHVRSTTCAESSTCSIRLSADSIIDCAQFCSMARFLQPSDRPNLKSKQMIVAGVTRIGLFSARRIVKCENLTIDSSLFSSCNAARNLSPMKLISWKEVATGKASKSEERQVIDLCEKEKGGLTAECSRGDSPASKCGAGPPLCATCLLPLTHGAVGPKVLVHCRSCFTVVHVQCASARDRSCSKPWRDSIMVNYLCPPCVSMQE